MLATQNQTAAQTELRRRYAVEHEGVLVALAAIRDRLLEEFPAPLFSLLSGGAGVSSHTRVKSLFFLIAAYAPHVTEAAAGHRGIKVYRGLSDGCAVG